MNSPTRLTPLVAAVLLIAIAAFAQRNEAGREKLERAADILAALGARDGMRIADLGSADGFYSVRIARAVAPTGRAYAVDIDQAALDKLKARAADENLANIEIIRSEPADPGCRPLLWTRY